MRAQRNDPPRFIELLSAPQPITVTGPALDAEIDRRLAAVRDQQGSYQPIFGVDPSEESSPRRDLLVQNCQFVESHFRSVLRKQQVRILDVGSNVGFVTLTLAKTFPHILGAEIDSKVLELANLLAAKASSPARFANVDILQMIAKGDADFENIDCVLLFNVIHQMIFAHGLSYVQTALKKIVQGVDAVFVELATRDQYVPHKKDHLLPEDADEVLGKCGDCDIQRLRASPRPLYLIRRRRLNVAEDRVEFDTVDFSGNTNAQISRKYYLNRSEFIKVYRFTAEQGPVAFEAEVKSLLAIRAANVCPQILDWKQDRYAGYIRTERLYGRLLAHQIDRYNTQQKRDKLIVELLRLSHELDNSGIYQNDFTAHNIIVMSDGSLRIIDFEQARSQPIYDPFAFFLWLVSDLHTRRADWYKKSDVEKLVLKGKTRADFELYPKKSEMAAAGLNPQFIEDAFSATDWSQFVKEWYSKLTAMTTLSGDN